MAFRSSNSASGNAASLDVTAPAGVASGDILIALWSQGGAGNATITWPSGFTELASSNSATHFNTNRIAVKVATGSEPASYTIGTSVSDLCVAGVAAWSGRDTAAVLSAQTTLSEAATSTPISVSLTGVTAANGDDIAWIAMRVPSAGGSLGAGLWTPPTSYTERIDVQATTYITASLASRDNVSAGATGAIVGTLNNADDSGYAGFVVALPAAAGGGGAGRGRLVGGKLVGGNLLVRRL